MGDHQVADVALAWGQGLGYDGRGKDGHGGDQPDWGAGMSGISTHVLDVAAGRPAPGMIVALARKDGDVWGDCGGGQTDPDGRCRELLAANGVEKGLYRLTFQTGPYFACDERRTLYPEVTITFAVEVQGGSYHIPLLLSPFGYTTYRGS